MFGLPGTFEGNSTGTYYAAVRRTGQTVSYYPGDDGDLQRGVPSPAGRFTDHGNGTVTDTLTGLMWVKAPHALSGNSSTMSWTNALNFCNGLSYADHTDWRLPNLLEIESLIDYSRYVPPAPCLPADHPFVGIVAHVYWSSTTLPQLPNRAYYAYLLSSVGSEADKTINYRVWPVRDAE